MRALKLTHDFDFVSNLFRTENRSASKMLETNMRKVAQDKKAVEILFLSKYVQSQDGRSLSEKTLENVNKEENLERRSENSTIFRRMRAIRRYENETNVDKSTSTTFFLLLFLYQWLWIGRQRQWKNAIEKVQEIPDSPIKTSVSHLYTHTHTYITRREWKRR